MKNRMLMLLHKRKRPSTLICLKEEIRTRRTTPHLEMNTLTAMRDPDPTITILKTILMMTLNLTALVKKAAEMT